MKKSDEILLKQLKPFGLRFVGEAEWALLEKAVDEAGSVTAVDATARYIIEKASFASRSEAARYAANMRWRGSNPKGLEGAQEEARAKAGAESKSPTDRAMDRERARLEERRAARTEGEKPKEDKAAKKQRVSEIRATLKDKDISDLAGAIRREFRAQGKQIPPALRPYLDAMGSLSSVKDRYFEDTGASVVAYALSNMGTFKGDVAAAIKEELKARLKGQSFVPEKGSGPKQSMEGASSSATQSKGSSKQVISPSEAQIVVETMSSKTADYYREAREKKGMTHTEAYREAKNRAAAERSGKRKR